MSSFAIAFVSLAFLLGAFAYVALPAQRRIRRVVVSATFALILGALFFGYSDMLGRPKSARLELFRAEMAALPDWSNTLVVSHWGFILTLTGKSVTNCALLRCDPTEPAPEQLTWRA